MDPSTGEDPSTGDQQPSAPKEPNSSVMNEPKAERKDMTMKTPNRGKKLKATPDNENKGPLPFLEPAIQSHVLFFLGAGFWLNVLPSSFTVRLANSDVLSLFTLHFPLICTVAAIYQFKEGEQQHRDESNNTKWLQQPSRGFLVPSMEETFRDELTDWLRFWMVRAAVEAIKTLVAWSSVPPEVKLSLLQLEMLFYIWVFTIPLLQREKITGYAPPSKRPLRFLCKRLGKYSLFLVETASSAVPLEWWQTNVVGAATQLCNTLILVKMLEQPFADRLLQLLLETRTFVVPGLVAFLAPGFLNQFGVVYVKFVLAVAKSFGGVVNHSSTPLWLQYWVLHASIDTLMYYFSPLWWLIPFSTPGLFILWYYLTTQQTIQRWYTELETELKNLGLMPAFPGEENDAYGLHQTKTAKILALIWHVLPKAKDAEEYGPPTNPASIDGSNPMDADKTRDAPVDDDDTTTATQSADVNQPPAAKKSGEDSTSSSQIARMPRAAAPQRVRRSAPSASARKGKNDIIHLSHKDNISYSYKEPPGRKLNRKSRSKATPSKETSEQDFDEDNQDAATVATASTFLSQDMGEVADDSDIKSVGSEDLDPDESIFRRVGEEVIDEEQEDAHYENLLENLLSDEMEEDMTADPPGHVSVCREGEKIEI